MLQHSRFLGKRVWLSAAIVVLAASVLPRAHADEKGKITVEKIEYRGWKNNLRLSNGDAELIVTLDVGPRILGYRLAGGTNVFKEFAEQLGKSGEKEWMIRGGHRLWLGPEDLTRTYALDNAPVAYKEIQPGLVRLTPPPDSAYGVQKEIDLQLAATGSKVAVTQRVTNVGRKPAELALWTLTVLNPGGAEVIPLPSRRPHPGPPKNARSPADYAPNQLLALWPFFDFKDPRWSFGAKYIVLRQDATRGPTKIGLAHRQGWVGYLNAGTLFVKRFGYEQGRTYPDQGVNFETFTNEDMLEAECLGPLVTLAPGMATELTEHWELFANVPALKDEAGIDEHILPRVSGK